MYRVSRHAYAPTTGKTSQGTADKLRGTCKYWLHPEVGHETRGEALLARLRSVGDTPLVEVDAALLAEFMRTIAPLTGRATLNDVLFTIRRSIRHQMQQPNPLVDRNVADDVDMPKPGKERVSRPS